MLMKQVLKQLSFDEENEKLQDTASNCVLVKSANDLVWS